MSHQASRPIMNPPPPHFQSQISNAKKVPPSNQNQPQPQPQPQNLGPASVGTGTGTGERSGFTKWLPSGGCPDCSKVCVALFFILFPFCIFFGLLYHAAQNHSGSNPNAMFADVGDGSWGFLSSFWAKSYPVPPFGPNGGGGPNFNFNFSSPFDNRYCSGNSYYDPRTQTCVCRHNWVGPHCLTCNVTCPVGTVADSVLCHCKPYTPPPPPPTANPWVTTTSYLNWSMPSAGEFFLTFVIVFVVTFLFVGLFWYIEGCSCCHRRKHRGRRD